MNQAKSRISSLKDKVENLDQIRKEYEEKLSKQKRWDIALSGSLGGV